MKKAFHCVSAALVTMSLAWLVGCGGAAGPASDGAKVGEAEHAHPSEGPHGGHLIELGNEEYHAELVHDEKAETVTIYLLDGAAKEAVAIEAPHLLINLKHDGKGEQFQLAASPQSTDPAGKSSRFATNDKELAHDLDAKGADAQLVLEIGGKQFRGKIEHDHDEAGHKH